MTGATSNMANLVFDEPTIGPGGEVVSPDLEVVARAAVSVCVLRGESVLLVRRGRQPNCGVWSLPGGKLEIGETAADAARREVFEETGLRCRLGAVVGINDVIHRGATGRITHHYLIAVFAATAPQGDALAGDDAQDVRFVALSELDGFDLDARVVGLINIAASAGRE
jgi:8-oxo-dGTP diphosphatase